MPHPCETEIYMTPSTKNFGFKRKAGILMPISSLPSKYGIGGFGKEARKFVDFLSETKTKCWQVLPLNPTSYGDSPYQSPASSAGNPYFIDLEALFKKGLLTKDELAAQEHNTKRVEYGWIFENRYPALRRAYSVFLAKGYDKSSEYKRFVLKNKSWLTDYALFMALKIHYSYAPFTTWAAEHRTAESARKQEKLFSKECGFWKWVQFEFFTEWEALRAYAHSRGIMIIGDMPIYVAHDSVDVWSAPEQFMLDENMCPKRVAGCPPDDYSPDGQLWGNPIYNWDYMKNDGFAWWKARVGAAFKLYDILRIDHFRGFSGYYSIPYGAENAKDGRWESAPGIELFDAIKEKYPKAKIIAEDLGFITDDVRELLSHTGFPGMKMLQFAFFSDNSEYLPREYKTDNCVVYPATHDSDCIASWCKSLDKVAKARFDRECPRVKEQKRGYDLIEYALASRANLAIVPIQDYLSLSNEDGRMNTPSVAEGNWSYRLSPRYNTACNRKRISALYEKTRRAAK